MVVGFARLNGYVVGIVANQPMVLAGCIDIKAAIKATHFIRICDAYNVPIITLQDARLLPGKEQEYGGIIRNGARMIYASEATVPKLMIIPAQKLRRAYCVMSSNLRGDLLYAWPNAEIAVMGAEEPLIFSSGATCKRPKTRGQTARTGRGLPAEIQPIPHVAAARVSSTMIDPADSRRILIRSLEVAMSKRERQYVPRKHGISPM